MTLRDITHLISIRINSNGDCLAVLCLPGVKRSKVVPSITDITLLLTLIILFQCLTSNRPAHTFMMDVLPHFYIHLHNNLIITIICLVFCYHYRPASPPAPTAHLAVPGSRAHSSVYLKGFFRLGVVIGSFKPFRRLWVRGCVLCSVDAWEAL